ncbi:acyl-CoA reductase [Pedobacter metabolipauper]|uniref:Acyl-CoA reductase LuxC n=1 Tax=Pedobacter metabolipauper TaxID=425513 RepID=A0A4R6SU27_9SPHI|nr:acyl-CoA reductase [Pedobacter metabolipauper]TDQ08518.1 acyl-CoA reductase LuxC [Pedobacter metabolipauper]
MPILTAEKLIIAFKKLSDFMLNPSPEFKNLMQSARNSNAWFTAEEVEKALLSLHIMLNPKDLETWFKNIDVTALPKKVGLILAGNIPMVGFHDVLSVLATGNTALIKLSSSDDKLIPALLHELVRIEPLLADRIVYAERLKDFDAVIATGSNNSSRYFEYYFSKVPNIIRKNRTSVAVLDGHETPEEIALLGKDIFDYFGLGCRNVSKLYIPEAYDIKNFFEPIESYSTVSNQFKYNNNYDYNKSIYLVNRAAHYDNGFLLLKEDSSLSSPLAVLFYERYKNLDEVTQILKKEEDTIQCVVTNTDLTLTNPTLGFGESQHPKLWDYADSINTIDFLLILRADKN